MTIQVFRVASQQSECLGNKGVGAFFEETLGQAMMKNDKIIKIGVDLFNANWRDVINRQLTRNADKKRRQKKAEGGALNVEASTLVSPRKPEVELTTEQKEHLALEQYTRQPVSKNAIVEDLKKITEKKEKENSAEEEKKVSVEEETPAPAVATEEPEASAESVPFESAQESSPATADEPQAEAAEEAAEAPVESSPIKEVAVEAEPVILTPTKEGTPSEGAASTDAGMSSPEAQEVA